MMACFDPLDDMFLIPDKCGMCSVQAEELLKTSSSHQSLVLTVVVVWIFCYFIMMLFDSKVQIFQSTNQRLSNIYLQALL